MSGQLATYQIDRNHIAISDNSDPQRRSQTIGEQRSQGVELDFNWRYASLSLLGSYAYTNAFYLKNQPQLMSGSSLPHIPEHAGKLWLNYHFGSGLNLGGGIYAQSGVYLEDLSGAKSESFYSLDASLNYAFKHIKISTAIKNLSNERYFESLNYFGGRFVPSQPRSVYFKMSINY